MRQASPELVERLREETFVFVADVFVAGRLVATLPLEK